MNTHNQTHLVGSVKNLKKQLEQAEQIIEKLWCKNCQLPQGGQLSDCDIKRLVNSGRIKITPRPDLGNHSVLGTCKLDLRLGAEAMVLDATRVSSLDLTKPIPNEFFRNVNIKKNGEVIIHPNKVIITTTLEWVRLPECISGRLEGKSSIARKGGSVQAAPIFDAGWNGRPMLELHNVGETPIVAHYGQPICAMSFEHMTSATLKPYAARAGVRYSQQTRAGM